MSKNNNKRNKKNKRKTYNNNGIQIQLLTDAIELSMDTDRSINIFDTIKVLPQFLKMKEVFQQFRLQRVSVTVFPMQSLQGDLSRDNIVRVSIITNPTANIDPDTNKYGKTICAITRPVTKEFTTSGRQNDFHYWFDTADLNVGPSCAVLVGTLRDSTQGFITTLQLKFTVQFRYPCVYQETGKENRVEVFKYLPKEKRTQKEEEEEEEIKEEIKEKEIKKRKK